MGWEGVRGGKKNGQDVEVRMETFYQSQTSSPVLGSENPSSEKHF